MADEALSAQRPAYPKAPPKDPKKGFGDWKQGECAGGGCHRASPGSHSEGLCAVYTTVQGDPQQQGKQRRRGMWGGGHTVRPGVALLPNTSSPMRCPSCSPVKHFPKYCQGGRQVRGRSCNPAWHHRTSGRWVPCSERPAGPLQTRRPGSAPGV